jgi:hypothetical protein
VAQGFRVSIEDGIATVFELYGKPIRIENDLQARRQPNEVIGICQWVSFVEIVHAPAKPALGISPRTETVHVHVSDRQNFGSAAEIGTNRWPQLSPPVKRSP